MIIVLGFNVFPNEIEEVVANHVDVENYALIGIPDNKLRKVVRLFVVTANPELSKEEIKVFCKVSLTA